jgi:hypothetical protein
MKSGNMKIRNYIIIGFLCLQAIAAFAQHRYSSGKFGDYYNRYYGGDYGQWSYTRDLFSDTSFISKIKFKTITYSYYQSEDTNLEHKKIRYKIKTTYNEKGDPLLKVKTDETGRVLSKREQSFDFMGRRVVEKEYDTTGLISSDTLIYYNAVKRLRNLHLVFQDMLMTMPRGKFQEAIVSTFTMSLEMKWMNWNMIHQAT